MNSSRINTAALSNITSIKSYSLPHCCYENTFTHHNLTLCREHASHRDRLHQLANIWGFYSTSQQAQYCSSNKVKGLNMLGSLKCHRKKRKIKKTECRKARRETQIRKGFRVSVETFGKRLPLYLLDKKNRDNWMEPLTSASGFY